MLQNTLLYVKNIDQMVQKSENEAARDLVFEGISKLYLSQALIFPTGNVQR